MRRRWFVLIMTLTASLFATGVRLQAQQTFSGKTKPVADCFALSIKTEKDTFRLKEPIEVAAILRNVTDLACKIPLEIPLVFSMTVKDQNGRDVPRTKAFQDALKAGPEKKIDYPIPARLDFETGEIINNYFSMETPGVYS